MKFIVVFSLLVSLALVQTTLIIPSIILGTVALNKLAKVAHIPSIANVDAEVEANVLGQKVNAEAAYGVGENSSGAHAGINGDILGQNPNIHGDIVDGHNQGIHSKEIYKDEDGRYYVLVKQYVGSDSYYVRRYLTEVEIRRYMAIQNGKSYELNFDTTNHKIGFNSRPAEPNRELNYLNRVEQFHAPPTGERYYVQPQPWRPVYYKFGPKVYNDDVPQPEN